MFERFTDRARRVLVLAQEEARAMRHDFIGTEHILLGLQAEGEGVAAKALEAVGVTLDDLRAEIEQTISPGTEEVKGAPPFTPRSKKVLELSLREALRLGHNYIGTEHILLGLIREGDGAAAQVLLHKVGDLDRVRQAVIEILSGYEPLVATPPSVRVSMGAGIKLRRNMTPAAAAALTLAETWAAERSGRLLSLDLLLALATEAEGRAARILERAGLTAARIEELAREVGVEGTSDETADEAAARHITVEFDNAAVTVRIDDPEVASKVMELMRTDKGGSIVGVPDLAHLARTVLDIATRLSRSEEEASSTAAAPVSAEEAKSLLEAMSQARIEAAAAKTEKPDLTSHEAEVLEGLAAGVSIDDVAGAMGISVEQAESMARNVRDKLESHRAQQSPGEPAEE